MFISHFIELLHISLPKVSVQITIKTIRQLNLRVFLLLLEMAKKLAETYIY